MLSKPASYLKAILAAVGALTSALVVALDDGSMTVGDGVKAAGLAVAAFVAVYMARNQEPSSP